MIPLKCFSFYFMDAKITIIIYDGSFLAGLLPKIYKIYLLLVFKLLALHRWCCGISEILCFERASSDDVARM